METIATRRRYRERSTRFSLAVWPILCVLGAGAGYGWFDWKARTKAEEARRRSDVELALAKDDIAKYSQALHRGKMSLTDLYKRTHDRAERAAKVMTGADAVAMQTTADTTGRLFEASKKHDQTLGALELENVLDASTMKDADELEKRKTIVRNFRQANREFQRVLEGSDQPAEILEIRTVDEKISTQILGGLEILESTWGHWRAKSHDAIAFERATDQQRWQQLISDIQTTQAEGMRLRVSFSSTPVPRDVSPTR